MIGVCGPFDISHSVSFAKITGCFQDASGGFNSYRREHYDNSACTGVPLSVEVLDRRTEDLHDGRCGWWRISWTEFLWNFIISLGGVTTTFPLWVSDVVFADIFLLRMILEAYQNLFVVILYLPHLHKRAHDCYSYYSPEITLIRRAAQWCLIMLHYRVNAPVMTC